jgi:hypothetical protein
MFVRCICTLLHNIALLVTIKKYFEFKANQVKKGKHNQGRPNLSEKECDDVSIALIVRKTTKVVKMFNK